MKKDRFKIINFINWCLLFSLPILLLTVNVKTSTIDSRVSTKNLATSLFNKVVEVEAVEEDKKEIIEEKEEKQEVLKEEKTEYVVKNNNNVKDTEKKEPIDEVVTKPVEVPKQEVSDVLATYTGKMSFYNANCRGCTGITSTGTDISDGRIYYNDSQYGNVRIIAAGTEIPKWSIVRLKNTSLGDNTLAIVLDRGGAIGLGKTFLIDMLTNTTENKGGVERNVTVEVIRKGK